MTILSPPIRGATGAAGTSETSSPSSSSPPYSSSSSSSFSSPSSSSPSSFQFSFASSSLSSISSNIPTALAAARRRGIRLYSSPSASTSSSLTASPRSFRIAARICSGLPPCAACLTERLRPRHPDTSTTVRLPQRVSTSLSSAASEMSAPAMPNMRRLDRLCDRASKPRSDTSLAFM